MSDELFMRRCFDLAVLGAGTVAPNPPVGAVLVHGQRIIGEGFHRTYGEAHAEVNAIRSVAPSDRRLLPDATLYVSLEPCCVYGKTPPCTNLIIREKIARVVISCLDFSPAVNGRGVALLREAGIDVTVGVLEKEGQDLVAQRMVFVRYHRPYIILKFARTANGFFAASGQRQWWISNAFSKRLTHKWRSEVDAIMVGTNTARIDNPQLTNRLFFGSSPLRIVLDPQQKLSSARHLFDGRHPTLVLTGPPAPPSQSNLEYLVLDTRAPDFLEQLLGKLAEREITALMVEGGARLIRQFLDKNLWDEARVLVGPGELPDGIPAPALPYPPRRRFHLSGDEILIYFNR